MNNDEQKLDALTNQLVTISLGGRQYQARRATLFDVGLMNRKRKELSDKGDTANIDMDVVFTFLYQLMKDVNQNLPFTSAEGLMRSIPLDALNDVFIALETVGLKQPQTPNQQNVGTGA